MIFLNVLILIIAFIALIKGADLFVEGSSSLAKNLKISTVVIGLTVVAIGTSMPELAVSVSAAATGSNEIAFSNVVGSNIFNILGVLGLCAIIKPLPVESVILKRDYTISFASTILVLLVTSASLIFTGILFTKNMNENVTIISRFFGIMMILIFTVYIIYLVINAKNNKEKEDCTAKKPLWKCILLISIGLALIITGGKFVVYSARNIARFFGMSETLIGVTIVAVGTSLPELVTSVVAAKKGENSLAVGNIIGSNIFNLLFILGVSAVIKPISINAASVYDMLILTFITLMSWIFSITGKRIARTEGMIMILCYIASTIFAIVR